MATQTRTDAEKGSPSYSSEGGAYLNREFFYFVACSDRSSGKGIVANDVSLYHVGNVTPGG